MAKRLNRLLAALAATATLATGITASAWAGQTADGKVPLDVKATDGTTLDGSTINLYKVGEYDSPQYDKDGQLAGIHATSIDTDDRTGFTVGEDGTRTAIAAHGKAAKAAATAGVTVSDDTDPLDAVWRLDTVDTRITAFAQAYAKELADTKATPDETTAGAATTRVKPGLYVAIRGTDTNTAVLAATSDADGRTISGRNMGSVSLTGTTTTRDDAKDDSLLDKAKTAVKGLLGLSDAAQTPTDSDTEVPKLAGKLTVAEAKGTDASNVTTRIWRIGDLGDATNTVVKGLEDGTLTEKAAIKRLDSLTGSTPVASVKGTGLVQTGAGWFLTDSDGTRHVTAVGSDRTGNSLYDGEVFVEGPKRSEAETRTKTGNGDSGISTQSSRSARSAVDTVSTSGGTDAAGRPVPTIPVKGTSVGTNRFVWHSDQGDREAFCLQPQAYGPNSGASVRVALQNSGDLPAWRAILFYGVGGPGNWFKANGVSDDDGRAMMHIQLSWMRARQTGDPMTNYTGNVYAYSKGKAWLDFINTHRIDNDYVDYNGSRYFISTYELTPTGSQSGRQILVSMKTSRVTTPSIGTKAVASGATAGGTQPVHDSITVTNPNSKAITLNKVTTTLHVKGGKTASKTVTGKTVPAGGSLTFDSATFTPSDLGDKVWKAGVTYWFDATVKASDTNLPLLSDLNHDGSNDAAQQFKLTMDADFSTKAQDTFTQAGGTGAVHDRLLLKSGSDALTADLDVRVTLNWNASPTGTAGTKSLTKVGVFKAGAASSDLPDFTPSDFGWTSWKGGRYWYDVTIPAQKDIIAYNQNLKAFKSAETTAAESWTAAVPWTLDLAKLAYIGQPGSGRWDNEPVKGATFTLTETTDRTGDTAVSGAKTLTVTTDRNGRAHLTDGTIATDGVKWFKLVETQAPSSYKTPDAGTFWMVKVTGSADGATVTVTGSDKTAQALLKSVDGSTLTVGDQFQGNIMPPLTGGTYDVMRGLALAGGIMLAMLAGGVLWTRRRTDARHAR